MQNPDSYEQAFDLADNLMSSCPQIFGCAASELPSLDYVNLVIEAYHEIETVRPSQDRIFHRVTAAGARALYFSAQENPDIFDVMVEICTRNLYNDAPLPDLLRYFIASELKGEFVRKKRRGRSPSNGFAYRAFMYGAASYVSGVFDLPLTRNESSPDDRSACDVIADVSCRHGIDINFVTLRDWCIHKDYQGMRKRAKLLDNYISDKYLYELGILKGGRR